jgi:peptidoglycan/LPS O-acetylase OafA/YrhL
MGFDNRVLLSTAQAGTESVQAPRKAQALERGEWHGVNAAHSPGHVTQPRARASGSYRPDVDGLRALAILSVVAYHVGVPHFGGGFVGVDVFFVISGYLISSHIYRDQDRGAFSLKAFYERRAKRILPAFFVVVVSCYILASLLLAPMELRRFATQAISALTSTSNIYFWRRTNYFAPAAETQPLLMTWSLGVEEQFYLFFPLLMILLNRWGRRVRLLALGLLSAIALITAVFQVTRFPIAAFFLLPSRWWELGGGTLLGLYERSASTTRNHEGGWRREGLGMIGSLLLLWPIFAYHSSTVFPALSAVPPVLGSVCLLSARDSWVNRRLLSAKPLVSIGLISYSWYLWHWPLLSFARTAAGGPISSYSAVLMVLLALLLAIASYYLIERPFRRRAARPRTLLRYGVVSLLFLVPGVAIYMGHGFPQRYPLATAVEQEAALPDPTLCIESGAFPHKLSETCRPDTSTRPTLAILGDSHASALARYMRSAGIENGWNVTEYTRISCPQLGSIARASPRNVEEARECLSYNRRALEIVLADPHIKTVLLAGFWSAPFGGIESPERYVAGNNNPADVTTEGSWANFKAGLDGVTRDLQGHGKTVVLTTDVPQYKFDPLLRELSQSIPLRRGIMMTYGGEDPTSFGMDRVLEQRDLRANAIVRSVAEADGVQLIDLTAALCAQGICRYMQSGHLFYMDSNHLTIAGAKFALGKAPLFPRLTH